jgi:hypothetical protein
VPLTRIQIDVLALLASQRDPESYVAGGTPLNQHTTRFSGDIDIFHDVDTRVRTAAENDAAILTSAGFEIEWLRKFDQIFTAKVNRNDEETRLEWVVDSDYRFFPTVPDATFGYVLHPVDFAMNKVMAAAGRKKLRDFIDLLTIDQTILPLGAVVWAAVEKSPGFSPDGLIAEIRRNSNFPRVDWNELETTEPLDPVEISGKIRAALKSAEEFVARMPSSKAGLLFLENGKVVQPDPSRLESYTTHAGQRRGHWPSSPEIANAMFDAYRTKN